MVIPFAAGQRLARQEDLIGSGFVAQALVLVDRADLFARLGGDAQGGDGLVEGRLVVLDLSDQVDAGASGLFEGFFWQCMASTVSSDPGKPSSAMSFWTAGISLDFSSQSM